MLPYFPPWVHLTFFIACPLAALIFGGVPERIVGALTALSLLHSRVLQPHWAGDLIFVDLVKHILQFGAYAYLSIRFDRWWLLVIGAVMLLQIATDCADLMMHLSYWVFGTASVTWGYIAGAAMLQGTWSAHRAHVAVSRRPQQPPPPDARSP